MLRLSLILSLLLSVVSTEATAQTDRVAGHIVPTSSLVAPDSLVCVPRADVIRAIALATDTVPSLQRVASTSAKVIQAQRVELAESARLVGQLSQQVEILERMDQQHRAMIASLRSEREAQRGLTRSYRWALWRTRLVGAAVGVAVGGAVVVLTR